MSDAILIALVLGGYLIAAACTTARIRRAEHRAEYAAEVAEEAARNAQYAAAWADECADPDWTPPTCATCDDLGELYSGRVEHDTGQPITAECPDCPRTTR